MSSKSIAAFNAVRDRKRNAPTLPPMPMPDAVDHILQRAGKLEDLADKLIARASELRLVAYRMQGK